MQCINHVWEGRGRPSYVQTVKINTQTNSVIFYYSIKNIDISEKYNYILQDVTTGGENKTVQQLLFFTLFHTDIFEKLWFTLRIYQCLPVRLSVRFVSTQTCSFVFKLFMCAVVDCRIPSINIYRRSYLRI